MYGKIFFFLATVACVMAYDFKTCQLLFKHKEVDEGKLSTGCIAINLCANMYDAQDAAAFHACYEGKLGEDVFLECQQEAFAHYIDTPENVKDVCTNLKKFGTYGKCLGEKFEEQNINKDEAVRAVNKCQGAIFKMGNGQ